MLSRLHSLFIFSLILLPLGCGGGDQNEGVFVDSPVEGLSYESNGSSGETDAAGAFIYSDGDMIRFFLGDTVLGEALGQGMLSPFDLVPGAEPITDSRDIIKATNSLSKDPQSPLETVINLAFFLQNIDEDGDPTNGIPIPPLTSTLLDGVSINFQKKAENFERQAAFRGLLNDGFNQGLWGGGRPMRSWGQAMDHLYETLGLTPEIYIPSRFSGDDGNDGSIDFVGRQLFDEEGRFSGQEIDDGNDGSIDGQLMIEYNDFDKPSIFWIDSNGDGTPEQIASFFYDDRGYLIRQEADTNDDGMPDAINKITVNELGYPVLLEADDDANGTNEKSTTSFFDENGNSTRDELDIGDDGTIDSVFTSQYDDQGRLIREENDSDANGTADGITLFFYDINGNLIRRENDSDANGSPNSIATFIYDENNNMIRDERDDNADGTLESITSYEYDELGNVTRRETDTDANGSPNSIEMTFYDEMGRRIRIEQDDDANGTIEDVAFFDEYEPATWRGFLSFLID